MVEWFARPVLHATLILPTPVGAGCSTSEKPRFTFNEEKGRMSQGPHGTPLVGIIARYLRLEYGQRRPGQAGRPLEVSEGQTLKQVDFALPRMSAISGRITDECGEPIEGVGVLAMRHLFYEGRRRLVPVAGAVRTDDEGEFRIQRLAPGTYHVMASTRETWTVVEGGREVVLGYLPTYFPGTGTVSDARRVTVGVGDHVRTVDFALVSTSHPLAQAPGLDGRRWDVHGRSTYLPASTRCKQPVRPARKDRRKWR